MVFSPGVSRLPNSTQCREDPGNSRAGNKTANMGSKSVKQRKISTQDTYTSASFVGELKVVSTSNSEPDTAGPKATSVARRNVGRLLFELDHAHPFAG